MQPEKRGRLRLVEGWAHYASTTCVTNSAVCAVRGHAEGVEDFVTAIDASYRAAEDELAHRVEQEVEQRTAELRRAEESYRGMFENATDGIFQTTADGHYLNCNRAVRASTGMNRREELKASVRDIKRQLYVEDETRPLFIRLMQEHDRVSGFEARIYRKDGSIIWISETARAVRDAQGQPPLLRRVCFGHHGAQAGGGVACAKARSGMRWRFAAPMTGCGTGTFAPGRFIIRTGGRRCWGAAMQAFGIAAAGMVSTAFIPMICSRCSRRLRRIARG